MTETMSRFSNLADALRERIGDPAATEALNVFATWAKEASVEADRIAVNGCYYGCTENHRANAGHFRFVASVLQSVHDAKILDA
ncbi:hypothetical protein ACIBI0_38505 [Microbispora rosea]|uniref:hypothetical protein n=1 Tax=Microbispora rosea TaxID=58117 RepID=UPI0037AE1EF8